MNIAPIVLFVYNRPKHTEEVLRSLAACTYAKEASLYIFSDAAKRPAAAEAVEQVRDIIQHEKWTTCFKQVTIVKAAQNKGLAKSVISGVTQVINEHGHVIVVEDDNRVSEDFIDYMSRALEFYQNNPKVGFIGAYKVPIPIPKDYRHDVFLMGRGSSYSWATWKDRWDLVDWDVSDYETFRKDKAARVHFNEYGEDRAAMLDAQMAGSIDSWAIRFGYAMFKNNRYAILPVKTRVENIGFDGSGVHNVATDTRFLVKIDSDLQPAVFEDVNVDPRIKKSFVQLFRVPLKLKIKRMLKKRLNFAHKGRGRAL
ncbi:MAG: glycosyltransferase [Oscillospiraceae bacterium]|nr:glycosyltransferase [Oscillospiraceae bacterium]